MTAPPVVLSSTTSSASLVLAASRVSSSVDFTRSTWGEEVSVRVFV